MVTLMEPQSKPYPATFFLRAVEDNAASIKEGRYVARDVETIRIFTGPNCVVEKEITDELKNRYKETYEAWKKTLETPTSGTAIKDWPVISPSAIKTLLNRQILTVQALSELDGTTCQAVAPECIGWREKARAWLEVSVSLGVTTEKINDLKIRIKALEAEIVTKDDLIARLTVKVGKK